MSSPHTLAACEDRGVRCTRGTDHDSYDEAVDRIFSTCSSGSILADCIRHCNSFTVSVVKR
eukprot:1362622-Pyramimonas_sp.AAC.1